jgi:hypothetical protein
MLTVERCRGFLPALVLLLILLPAYSFGAQTRIQSETLFRFFERDAGTEEDAAVLPVYEYLQIDTGELEDYGLSFYLQGWGRHDLADSGYYDDQTTGELLYGYLEYTRRANRCTVRFGRQYVFEGVANETVDGMRLSGNLGRQFSLSVYGGQPVGFGSENGREGDSIYGGRLAHRYRKIYEVGVSYKSVDSDDEIAEKMLGVDLSLSLPGSLSLLGFSSYNRESEDWAEHSYELRVPLGGFILKPYFQRFSYEDYFGSGANTVNPFRILAQSGEVLNARGLDAMWKLNYSWSFTGRIREHGYDQFDTSRIYSILTDWQGENRDQYGVEIGRTAAGDVADNEYTLARIYGYSEETGDRFGIDFISADLLLAYYDEEIYGEDRSLFVSFSGGWRLLHDVLSVKLSGDYSRDPYFDKDLRGMLTVSYTFDRY